MPLFNGSQFGDLTKVLREGVYDAPPYTGHGGPYPPPEDFIRITDSGDTRITDDGDTRIVDL